MRMWSGWFGSLDENSETGGKKPWQGRQLKTNGVFTLYAATVRGVPMLNSQCCCPALFARIGGHALHLFALIMRLRKRDLHVVAPPSYIRYGMRHRLCVLRPSKVYLPLSCLFVDVGAARFGTSVA
eukprot:6210829-Pleurochrysis_carterae.AAC.3